MVPIKIDYHPLPIFSFSISFDGTFPEKIEELNSRQLVAIAKIESCGISENDFLSAMTGIKKYVIKKLADFQRLKLMQLFSVFYDAKSFNSFIIKEINLHGTVLLAPRPKLGGVTFGQFIFADTWYTDYQISENINDLHRFVASLYLPKGQPFSEEIVEKSIKTISHESQAKLEAISLNYMFVREWLSDVYPLIFIKSDNDEIGKKLKKRQPVNSWIKIFENLVGDDIVNHDNYANMPIHNIFRFMTAKIKENMKRKR